MGYSLFRKRFREYTGLAPLEYQTSLRIRRACHLLSSSDLPIAQISEEAGFDTPAYFARYFRKRLNMSPSEYRDTHKKPDDYGDRPPRYSRAGGTASVPSADGTEPGPPGHDRRIAPPL